MSVVDLPGTPRIHLSELRCDRCGGVPAIFAPTERPMRCWCGPACAAADGAWPWAQADLVTRAAWDAAP